MSDFVRDIREGAKVGIIDADLLDGGTRHPNLALMKLSGYCKEQGAEVTLLESYAGLAMYDLVFVSKVFTFTWSPPSLFEHPNVHVGGTGFFSDGGEPLPHDIEHHKPDYDLYKDFVEEQIAEGRSRAWFADYLDYSIGFTTRGCFRKCSFCVNKKYDHAFRHSPVSEFLDKSRPYIYLWDDNFLAYPKWEEILDELEATGKPFQFRQGLDIRLLDKHRAQRLSNVRYVGDFIFAFDHIEDRAIIERKLKLWRSFTTRGTRLYVLCAFDSQDERDIENTFERIAILMNYGCLPYVMRYESYKESRWRRLYVNIARWCNQPQFFKKMSYREFCLKNQRYHKNQDTKCSALASMEEFEAEFPEIAARYFDLVYEERNMMMRHGRKFFGAPATEVSEVQRKNWERMRAGELTADEILSLYFDKDLDIVWANRLSGQDFSAEVARVFDVVKSSSLEHIFELLVASEWEEPLTPENIPQYSSPADVVLAGHYLDMLQESLSYEDLGMYLDSEKRKVESAHKKYGENHGKCAALLDLACLVRASARPVFASTPFGALVWELPEEEREGMLARLALRIPIIRRLVVDAAKGPVMLGDYMQTLAKTTKVRRKPNVTRLLDLVASHAERGCALAAALENVGREL